jgi:hypothetical protein
LDTDRPAWYDSRMSPTVFWWRGYRFFFFSREETRVHVHVRSGDGQVKFWLEPEISLVTSHGLSPKQVAAVMEAVQEHKDDIIAAWREHFRS